MRKKVLFVLISYFVLITMLLSITACTDPNKLLGKYYSDGSKNEYISVDVVNSDTDGIFSVKNLTLASYSIFNHTENNIKYEIEKTSDNIYYFIAEISKTTVSGTININTYVITIGAKKFTKS